MKLSPLWLVPVLYLTACAPATGGGGATTPPVSDPNYKLMTGNWEFTTSATSKAAPFTVLAGFVNEQPSDPSINDYTTAALQATSSTCFGEPPDLSFTGAAQGTALNLSSFSADSQVVTFSGIKDATATHLTGSYTVAGGCSDGAAGTLTGLLYQPLNGTYQGAATMNPASITLVLAQAPQGDGEGYSYLTGQAVFGNISCFSLGTMTGSTSYVIGSSVTINIHTNDPNGSQLVAKGSFDASAQTIILQSVEIVDGSCSGSLGQLSLSLNK
jgi:hypothetical protein